ncbi:MAG: competence/damage-inducible protein A [Candidatus Electryonea clarkiae]|nr:competence/damage-inducible protein A [Candidatus Electryonea clarkiae]MDP8288446.1 competence/damage-inducible protein A [Candidatus Electryonea clarkiae]
MNVEIIAIADEVLLGQVENTNAGWIARLLSVEGIAVRNMSVIPDSKEEILESFQRAFHRSDVTLITGGLGPTHDDKTKALIAQFFDLPIVFRNDLLEDVKKVYEKRQLSFIETSREQAEFPEGAVPMRNPRGTAPGIWVERQNRVFAAMPGVPYEMQGMMTDFIVPRLRIIMRGSILKYRTLHTVGIKEAMLNAKLDNREEVEKYARLAFLPSYSGVRLRLTVEAESPEQADQRLNLAEQTIRSRINEYIFGVGDDFTTEYGVGEILKKNRMMLTVAESCTGGLLAKRLTDVPGSSEWFERGFVTYSNESKQELLGVSAELIEEYGAVSAEVAEAMAEGALRNSSAQVALSVTGIAGPTGGTPEKPVGLVYVGYADANSATHHKNFFDADREVNRVRSVTAALVLLLDQLNPENEEGDPLLI